MIQPQEKVARRDPAGMLFEEPCHQRPDHWNQVDRGRTNRGIKLLQIMIATELDALAHLVL